MKVIGPFRSSSSKIYIQIYHVHVFSPVITSDRTNEYSCHQGLWRPCELLLRCKFTHSLTHGAEPFLRSRQLCSYSRTSQHFMELEGLLSYSQEPFTGPYPEPDPSSPFHPISLRSSSILPTHIHLGVPSGLFPSGFATSILYEFLFAPFLSTCPVHLTLLASLKYQPEILCRNRQVFWNCETFYQVYFTDCEITTWLLRKTRH
jgi:hypothetical protein